MQGSLAAIGGAALGMTLFSIWADWRRSRRRNIEAVGFMPWTLLTVLGTIATLFAFALALKFSG